MMENLILTALCLTALLMASSTGLFGRQINATCRKTLPLGHKSCPVMIATSRDFNPKHQTEHRAIKSPYLN